VNNAGYDTVASETLLTIAKGYGKVLTLTHIIHEFPIYSRHFYLYIGVRDVLRNSKPNYLQSREMLEIFTPSRPKIETGQNWGNNYS